MTATRRDFLKTSGALVVGLTVAGDIVLDAQGTAAGPYPDLDYKQLDSWIVIRPDNTATFFVGKTDLGQGTGTAFRQIMADELDMPYDKTSCVMGVTDVTVDQGGSGGSDALQTDGYPMRRVAAEARRVLLEMAAARLGVPVAQLTVSDGVVAVTADSSKRVTYGELIGGRKFNTTLTGGNINATTGAARLKDVNQFKIVGQSPQRYDIPAKVDGSLKWAVDVEVPGMLHARNVKPPVAGATLVSIDESSVKNVPGLVKVVSKGNYVAVVCEREEQAIQAARQLKVNWQKPATAAFPSSEDLYGFMRTAKPTSSTPPSIVGNPDAAMMTAAKVVEAEYEIPFQGHTSIGPAHAMADPSNNQMTIYSNDMKSYGMREGIAAFLQIPKDRIRVVWMEGPQAYGRTAADDAGFEAAYLAKELGRPVRVQWMRNEETAWDTKGPAFVVKARGGLDAQGNLIAFDYDARAADFGHLGYNEADTVLIAQLMGIRPSSPNRGSSAVPNEMYGIPNRRMTTHVVSLPTVFETPVRTGNLRDPEWAAVHVRIRVVHRRARRRGECRSRAVPFEDDHASAEDNGFKKARSIACIKAAADAFKWDTRPSPKRVDSGETLTGRGMAYTYRSQTVVAEIAEVEVNRRTGRVWVKRIVCAHDCGLVINPEALRRTIEGGMLHSMSRTLHEEVRFDTEKVTSVDWVTSPTLTHLDTPESIEIIFVNGDPNPKRADLPHYGAGETMLKPTLAAIANAVFDATGVRLRRVPFRNERVLAALKAAACKC